MLRQEHRSDLSTFERQLLEQVEALTRRVEKQDAELQALQSLQSLRQLKRGRQPKTDDGATNTRSQTHPDSQSIRSGTKKDPCLFEDFNETTRVRTLRLNPDCDLDLGILHLTDDGESSLNLPDDTTFVVGSSVTAKHVTTVTGLMNVQDNFFTANGGRQLQSSSNLCLDEDAYFCRDDIEAALNPTWQGIVDMYQVVLKHFTLDMLVALENLYTATPDFDWLADYRPIRVCDWFAAGPLEIYNSPSYNWGDQTDTDYCPAGTDGFLVKLVIAGEVEGSVYGGYLDIFPPPLPTDLSDPNGCFIRNVFSRLRCIVEVSVPNDTTWGCAPGQTCYKYKAFGHIEDTELECGFVYANYENPSRRFVQMTIGAAKTSWKTETASDFWWSSTERYRDILFEYRSAIDTIPLLRRECYSACFVTDIGPAASNRDWGNPDDADFCDDSSAAVWNLNLSFISSGGTVTGGFAELLPSASVKGCTTKDEFDHIDCPVEIGTFSDTVWCNSLSCSSSIKAFGSTTYMGQTYWCGVAHIKRSDKDLVHFTLFQRPTGSTTLEDVGLNNFWTGGGPVRFRDWNVDSISSPSLALDVPTGC